MDFKKSFLAFVAAGLVFTACKETAKETVATVTAKEAAPTEKAAIVGKVETASFHIEGMTCAVMCAAKIEKELAAMDGVQKATVDFDKKTATVAYDNARQSPEKLAAKVEAVADGKTYKVSDVKTTADHAMLMTGDPVNGKKAGKAKVSKKDKKTCGANDKKEGKASCCSGKKHCSMDEKSM